MQYSGTEVPYLVAIKARRNRDFLQVFHFQTYRIDVGNTVPHCIVSINDAPSPTSKAIATAQLAMQLIKPAWLSHSGIVSPCSWSHFRLSTVLTSSLRSRQANRRISKSTAAMSLQTGRDLRQLAVVCAYDPSPVYLQSRQCRCDTNIDIDTDIDTAQMDMFESGRPSRSISRTTRRIRNRDSYAI